MCISLLPQHYNYLWRLSWLHLPSAIYAINRGYYSCGILSGTVFLTSLNYWRNPEEGWRRRLDILCVRAALGYHLISGYNSNNKYSTQYYTITIAAVSCYPIGIYFYNKNQLWASTISHGFVHILSFIGNNLLYSG
jgi:hypothetical protein